MLQERFYMEAKIQMIISTSEDLRIYLDIADLAEKEKNGAIYVEALCQLLKLNTYIQLQESKCLLNDKLDKSECFLEIHSGAGGKESDDWAFMLVRMYTRWMKKNSFKYKIIDSLIGEEKGIKSIIFKVYGKNAFGLLKMEKGVHRLVRISPFSNTSKRHTSFASVWIYPQIHNDLVVKINESDLKIDTYRSSGAGGQHVNTTDSAVRITYLPLKIVVQCQNNKSQHKNKEECMSMLKSKIYGLKLKNIEESHSKKNTEKTEIGWGNQIRSYVLHPYKMIKDLRTNYQTSNVDAFLDGDINEFIHAALVQNLQIKLLK